MRTTGARDFERCLEQHGPWVLLLARSLGVRDPETLVHDAFVALWERMSCGASIDHPGAYLATIVRNAATRASTDRHISSDVAAFAEWISVTPRESDSSLDEAQVSSWMACLSAEQREVVVLRIWGDLTFEQIGMALGVSINTAASRYRYAIVRLKDIATRSKTDHERTRTRTTRHE